MAAVADPTLEFLDSLADDSKWVIKRRVPLFKPHNREKVNPLNGQKIVAYSVTCDDMPEIAANMRRNQAKGVPARITIGHVDPDSDESDQPRVVGYWLNAEPGTFGPDGEPCVYADAYVKRTQANEVKGRPYRSAEYYPATKEIRGAALLTRDPKLDLGTVELYRIPKGAFMYSAPGEFYMAEEKEEGEEKPKEIGMKPTTEVKAEGVPEGHEEWAAHMEHYAKANPWVGYAMHCYSENAGGAGMPSATDGQIPATPAKAPEDEMNRMQRDDVAVNYARLEGRLKQLESERENDRKVIAKLTLERDTADCERMVRTLQAEGYSLKDDTATLVKKLVAKSATDRDEMIQLIRDYSPKGAPQGDMIEVYSGPVEGDPAKAKPAAPSRQQVSEITKRYVGDPAGFEKALADLSNGTTTKN